MLLLVNRKAGLGHEAAALNDLRRMLERVLGRDVTSSIETVVDHQQARDVASRYLKDDDLPAAIITGGGGGTLRAVVEAICEGREAGALPGGEHVRVATLRMGSGNLIARQLGVPHDAQAGLKGILENLRKGRTRRCPVIRCETVTPDGRKLVSYGVTLGGFGQFGRTPADLARWRQRLSPLHRVSASLLRIERLNNLEYWLALSIRAVSCALRPSVAEMIEVTGPGVRERMRLLTGLATNFPFKALPVEPCVRLEDEAFSLHLIPQRGRLQPLLMIFSPRRLASSVPPIRVEGGGRVEMRLLDRGSAEYFLDEDPATFYQCLALEVAGSLAFVPGPNYRFSAEAEPR